MMDLQTSIYKQLHKLRTTDIKPVSIKLNSSLLKLIKKEISDFPIEIHSLYELSIIIDNKLKGKNIVFVCEDRELDFKL